MSDFVAIRPGLENYLACTLVKDENRRAPIATRLFTEYANKRLFAFRLFFDSNNFTPLIMTAAGAYCMRRANLTTVRAGNQAHCDQTIV
jgi:hypothetical protein